MDINNNILFEENGKSIKFLKKIVDKHLRK